MDDPVSRPPEEAGAAIPPATFFAAPWRSGPDELRHQIGLVTSDPVVNGLLGVVSGLVAVLNKNRQIVAVNDALPAYLGLRGGVEVLGLRPGEAISCVHARDMPAGCGTSLFCRTCGAALAIVACLGREETAERLCAAQVRRGDGVEDICLKVRACPLSYGGERFVLLFLQDVTVEQRWAALERIFFHDINNQVQGIMGTCELLLLSGQEASRDQYRRIMHLSVQLARTVDVQKAITLDDLRTFRPLLHRTRLRQIMREVTELYETHPAARDRRLAVPDQVPDLVLATDAALLERVLGNMLTNAFEATGEGGTVRLGFQTGDGHARFTVWNAAAIPSDVALRVFQRNFSTKSETGRGLGTYSMKLLGETLLGGVVDFTSSPEEGTTFRLTLPLGGEKPPAAVETAGRD
jgi:hypothetical protein